MKLTDDAKEVLGDVIEMAREGHSAKQIAEKVGRSPSYIGRMLRNLPKLIGQYLSDEMEFA
jgi:predicted transcriptional regulator